MVLNNNILQKQIEDSLVLCNVENESFYKLDNFSKEIFETVLNCNSVNEAYEKLINKYDVESDIIKKDLESLIKNLLKENIVHLFSK